MCTISNKYWDFKTCRHAIGLACNKMFNGNHLSYQYERVQTHFSLPTTDSHDDIVTQLFLSLSLLIINTRRRSAKKCEIDIVLRLKWEIY